MKNNLSHLVLVSLDMFAIFFSIVLAYHTGIFFESLEMCGFNDNHVSYSDMIFVYLIIFSIFYYNGIYTKRYDFWHESRQIIKSLILSLLVILSFFAFIKNIEYSYKFIIVFAFIYMSFLIPFFKNISKKFLFKIGLWHREAKIYGNDIFLKEEIFQNHYLGYVEANDVDSETVFINSSSLTVDELKSLIDKEIKTKHEVIFIPIINDYNIAQSTVYELSNTRTNLIVFTNRLKSRLRYILKTSFNYSLAILLLPVLLPIIAILVYFIKKESPGPVFFSHKRIGKDGKLIPTYKFRSMYSDAGQRLEKLLAEDEEVKKEWETNYKIKDDPRVTKIGAILRKTSLDELPQIFNVLKGEMSFVGPRPVIQEELDLYYKDDAEYYYMVKPGITGLWQVSGRSETDYDFRVATDKWYIKNWSLWLDIVILFKTVKVVFSREGAY